MSLVLNPGFVFIFQMAIMTSPIFQNVPWGVKNARHASLEFAFTRAISRFRLFWAKVLIYLLVCSSLGFSYLAFSAIQPTLTVRGAYGDHDSQKLGAFYAENFPGSLMHAPEREFGPHPIDIPQGNVANACAVLVVSLVFAVVLQFAQSLLPETKLSMYLLVGGSILLFMLSMFLPMIFGWERMVVSPYERFVAFIWRHPLIATSALVLFIGIMECICSRRFVQKEVL